MKKHLSIFLQAMLVVAVPVTVPGTVPVTVASAVNIVVDLEQNQGQVEFLAVGRPSFLKIRGEKGRAKGNLLVTATTLSGTLAVELSAFDTGLDMRNRHMKETYLEVEKFPRALLHLEGVSLPVNFLASLQTSAESVPFTAKLELHGVVREVKGVTSIHRDGDRVTGEAKFKLDLTDFAIAIPSYSGVTVAKEVSIIANINAPIRMQK